MLAKRLAALLVAVALVAGALWLRSRRDDNGSSDGPGTTVAGATTAAAGATTLTCIPELEEACRAAAAEHGLDVTVEAAGTTVDRLAATEEAGPVAWVTLAPLPTLVDELRSRSGLAPIFTTTTPVATTPLVLVGRQDQMAVLQAHCGGEVTWRCLGDVAGQPWSGIGGQAAWGEIKPAHDAADTSALGLLTFAAAVTAWFDRTDVSTLDLDDDTFSSWVRRLERSIPYFGGPQGTPFEQFLLLPSINVVATTEAEVNDRAGARRGQLTVTYPGGMPQADAVLATSAGVSLPGGSVDELAGSLTAGAVAQGWNAPAADAATPSVAPGLLQALRQLWTEVTR